MYRVFSIALLLAPATAHAQVDHSADRECARRYENARAHRALEKGQSRVDFMMSCRGAIGRAAKPVAGSADARRRNDAEARAIDRRALAAIAAITDAENAKRVGYHRANALRRQADRIRTAAASDKRMQGFVSAAELSSYKAGLDRIEREIGPR